MIETLLAMTLEQHIEHISPIELYMEPVVRMLMFQPGLELELVEAEEVYTLIKAYKELVPLAENSEQLLAQAKSLFTSYKHPRDAFSAFLLELSTRIQTLATRVHTTEAAHQNGTHAQLQSEEIGNHTSQATSEHSITKIQIPTPLPANTGQVFGRYNLELDLAIKNAQSLLTGASVSHLLSTDIFVFKKSNLFANTKQQEHTQHPSELFGTILHVNNGDTVLLIDSSGTASRYTQGTYSHLDLTHSTLLSILRKGTESETFQIHHTQDTARSELTPLTYMPHPAFKRIQMEMYSCIATIGATQEYWAFPNFLEILETAQKAVLERKNIPLVRDRLFKALDSYPFFDSSNELRATRERWKDMLNGCLSGGWNASVRTQELVSAWCKPQDATPPKLSFKQADAFYQSVFSQDKLNSLYNDWVSAGVISQHERETLQAEERYAFTGGSIWTLTEALIAHIAEPTRKQLVHEKVVNLCYQLKANADVQNLTLSDFLKRMSLLASEIPELIQTFSTPLVWEYLHSEVTGSYTDVWNAIIARVCLSIEQDQLLITDAQRREKFRTKTGQVIDTLRYDPEGNELIVKCLLSELVGESNPLRYYFRARSQAAENILQFSIPLASRPDLQKAIDLARNTSTSSKFDQQDIEEALLLRSLGSCIAGDADSCLALHLEGADSQAVDTLIEQLIHAAFPRNASAAPSDMQEQLDAQGLLTTLARQSVNNTKNQQISEFPRSIFKENQAFIANNPERQAQLSSFLLRPEKIEQKQILHAELKNLVSEIFNPNSQIHTSYPELALLVANTLRKFVVAHSIDSRAATNQQLIDILKKIEITIMEHNGWGGSEVSYNPFNRFAAKQERFKQALFISSAHMNSTGTGVIPYDEHRSILLTRREANQQDFSTFASWQIELTKRLGALASKEVVLMGHSMGGLVVLFCALLLPRELWEKTSIVSLTPVITNNNGTINMSEFVSLLRQHSQLWETFKSTDIIKTICNVKSAADVEPGLASARSLGQEVTHHLSLLNFDSSAPDVRVAFAATITGLVSEGILPDQVAKAIISMGDKLLVNWIVYKQLVRDCAPEITDEHGYQLAVHLISFIVSVSSILLHTRELSDEEIEYLTEFSNKMTIVVASGDKVLKPHFAIVKLQKLITSIVMAHNRPDKEEGHYVMGNFEENMQLICDCISAMIEPDTAPSIPT